MGRETHTSELPEGLPRLGGGGSLWAPGSSQDIGEPGSRQPNEALHAGRQLPIQSRHHLGKAGVHSLHDRVCVRRGPHAHSSKPTRASTSSTPATPVAALNTLPKTLGSYPYLFVLPLYRFLEVRDLPDIAGLFLLQLPDFLKNRGRWEESRQRVRREEGWC